MINYIYGDLFGSPGSEPIVHCISADAALSAGVAAEIEARYNIRHRVVRLHPLPGRLVITRGPIRDVLNLVTKERYWHLPRREDFVTSVRCLRNYLEHRSVRQIHGPLIGTGRDRLPSDWVTSVLRAELGRIPTVVNIYLQ